MTKQTCIEQTALFYQSWESRHVQEAVDTLGSLHGEWLEKELDEWRDGLTGHGWDSQKASDFVSDMRLLMKKGRIRGPWWRNN